MMGMQTMQAQQPMQGGGKGSMIQPQQQQQQQIGINMPQQPMPQDMGGGYGGELPTDYVGNTAQQQPRPMDMGMGMGQGNAGIPRQQYIGNNDVQRAANDMPGMPRQQSMQGGGKAAGGMGQSMGQQPRFGQPNRYSNTTQQPWDNANINPQPSGKGAGGMGGAGGKGAGMQQGGQMQGGAGKGQAAGGFPTAQTNFGQGAPLTQALPTDNTANLGQVDNVPFSSGS